MKTSFLSLLSIAAVFVLAIIVDTAIVMILWNMTVPRLFGLSVITFVDTLLLLAILRALKIATTIKPKGVKE